VFGLSSEALWNYLESTIRANVDLNIDPLPVLAHKLVGMTRVTVHVMVTVRRPTVGEQNQKLVDTLRVLRKIVLTKREISVCRWSTGASNWWLDLTGRIVNSPRTCRHPSDEFEDRAFGYE
jgi:hypothetical protein